MSLTPKNKTYYTFGISDSPESTGKSRQWFFNPKQSVFLNAYESGLTNKQLAARFFVEEPAMEKFIRKLKNKGVIPEGKKLRPNLIKLYKAALKKVKKWATNPTFENWYKYFGKGSGSGDQVTKNVGRNIRAYFTGEKFALRAGSMIGGEEVTRILDSLKIKKEIPIKAQNVLKTFTKDLFISKRADRGRDISIGNKLRNSFQKVIELNKEFKKNPGITLTQLGKNLYKGEFIRGDKETRLRLLTTISDDVAKYLQALTPKEGGKGFAREVPKGMSAEWSPPTGEKLKNIMARIASQTEGFRFQDGTLRHYKFSIRDAMLKLAPETTRNLRRVLEGTPGVIDEVVGLSATFKRAPGYTELMQLIPNKTNIQKGIELDRRFGPLLENALKGEFEGVDDFNKASEAFAKKWKIDTPLINRGGDPLKDILYFDQMSPEAQANVLKIADKGKGFTIKSTTLPIQAMGERFKEVQSAPALYKKLIDAVEHSPQTCRKILNYQTGGISTTCAAAINKDPVGSAKKLSNLEATSGPVATVKNAAKGFLGALGKFKVGKYGAIAAAGAIAQPLVKQFMNDDPSTYLTDPDQQAGMLEALIEGERPKPKSEILDTSLTGAHVAATAAAVPGTSALWKARRQPFTDKLGKTRAGMGMPRAALGPVGKFIAGAYTPAGLLATEPLRIAQMRREGESWGEIAKSPTLWMGPAFADTMTKMATSGMKRSPLLARALSLGMSRPMLKTISRRFGMPGLVASLGLSGYDTYQDYKKKRGWFARDEE